MAIFGGRWWGVRQAHVGKCVCTMSIYTNVLWWSGEANILVLKEK